MLRLLRQMDLITQSAVPVCTRRLLKSAARLQQIKLDGSADTYVAVQSLWLDHEADWYDCM